MREPIFILKYEKQIHMIIRNTEFDGWCEYLEDHDTHHTKQQIAEALLNMTDSQLQSVDSHTASVIQHYKQQRTQGSVTGVTVIDAIGEELAMRIFDGDHITR